MVRTLRASWEPRLPRPPRRRRLLAAGGARADESELVLPDLASVTFLGMNGRTLLMSGILVCLAGLAFGLVMYGKLKNLPVHKSMREVSELIYETCKTYLVTQGKFILILEVFIGTIIAVYYGVLRHMEPAKVAVILFASLVGIAGSYGVAWFGIRINTFANSRTAFASLRGKPFPTYAIPLAAGMSIGTMLLRLRVPMLAILLFIPATSPACYRSHRESSAPPFCASRAYLHEDRRHRLDPREDRLQDQGRRRAQPRSSDCTGDNVRFRRADGRHRYLRRDGRRAHLFILSRCRTRPRR